MSNELYLAPTLIALLDCAPCVLFLGVFGYQFASVLSINKKSWVEYLLLAFAGFIAVFAFAPNNKSIFIILSLLIFFSILQNKPNNLNRWRLLSYAYTYATFYFASQVYWVFYSLYKVIAAGFIISLIAMIGASLFLATYLALAIFFYIRFKTKSEFINLLILFPSLWTIFEWLRGWLFGAFPWCEVGYTQVTNPIFRGFYPLFGNYSVSFICVTVSGVIFLVLQQKIRPALKLSKAAAQLACVYVAVLLLIGTAISDIEYTKPYGKPTSIALIQGNILETSKWSSDEALNVYKKLIASTKADIVMLPETGISQFENHLPKGYLDNLESVTKQNHSSLLIGIPVIIDKYNNYVNAALLLTGKGRPYYSKYHLVPFGEYIPAQWLLKPLYSWVSLPMVGFSSGAAYQAPLVASDQKLALNICYENGFNSELIKSAANSTIMVNLSDMVWYGNSIAKDEHLQLSQARALENQRYFVQVTNTGLTAVINPQGQIQSSLPAFKRQVLYDYVQGRIGVTPFEKYGNYPIIICCCLLIGLSKRFL